MVIHGQQAGLFIFLWPPRVEGGIRLPQFAQASPFPAAAGLGDGRGRTDQKRAVRAGVSGDRLAVTYESEAGGEFGGGELIVGRSLERQEGLQELLDLGGPGGAMVASGEVEGEGGWRLQPGGAQTKEVRPTDAQELGGGVRGQVAAVESVERLVAELEGETFGELMFCTRPLICGVARRAKDSCLPGSQHPSLLLFPPRQLKPREAQPEQSLFLDGEIALMLAMRRVVEEKPDYRALLTERVNVMLEPMRLSKALAAESYPDEC